MSNAPSSPERLEHEPPWLRQARTQHGVAELPGKAAHPQIVAYHACTTLRATSDEVAWCSAFMCWVFQSLGITSTRSAAARSWLTWGHALTVPRLGCVCVLSAPGRGERAGHVALWLWQTEREVVLYGGNQANRVGESTYNASRVLGYRWPFPPELIA